MHVFGGALSAARMDPDASPIAPWISSAYEATARSPKILHLRAFHNFCGQLVDCPVYAAFLEQHQSLSCRCSKFRREFSRAIKRLSPILLLSHPSFVGWFRTFSVSLFPKAIFDPHVTCGISARRIFIPCTHQMLECWRECIRKTITLRYLGSHPVSHFRQ